MASTLAKAVAAFPTVKINAKSTKLFFWHFQTLLVYPLTQVRHEVGESLQVRHGDSQSEHTPEVSPLDNVYPNAHAMQIVELVHYKQSMLQAMQYP